MDINGSDFKLSEFLRTIEIELIEEALEFTKGVKSQAAYILGMNRTTLVAKLKVLGLHAHLKPPSQKKEPSLL